MPKSKTKKAIKTVEIPQDLPEMKHESRSCFCGACGMSKTKKIAVILGIIILFLVAVNRGWIVSAIVNGKPIFRWTVNSTLMSRYGKQTLDNMITERLIADEAKKGNVAVTQSEIDAKEQEILKSFGGNITMDEVLQYQGMTKSDFDEQIRLQMLLTKLIGKDVVITDTDIANFRATNSALLVATDEAGLQKEAREAILTQQVGEKIQPWFAQIRNSAKIFTFAQ